MAIRIDVVFDLPSDNRYHQSTLDAVEHATAAEGMELDLRVVRTAELGVGYLSEDGPDALVIGPGTPYDNPRAAEEVVRGARERGVPLVGT